MGKNSFIMMKYIWKLWSSDIVRMEEAWWANILIRAEKVSILYRITHIGQNWKLKPAGDSAMSRSSSCCCYHYCLSLILCFLICSHLITGSCDWEQQVHNRFYNPTVWLLMGFCFLPIFISDHYTLKLSQEIFGTACSFCCDTKYQLN